MNDSKLHAKYMTESASCQRVVSVTWETLLLRYIGDASLYSSLSLFSVLLAEEITEFV